MTNGQEILGIVAPHPPIMVESVGGARSRATAESIAAMRYAAGVLERFAPETLVVISPHAPGYADALTVDTASHLSGSLADFGAPEVSVASITDSELAAAILREFEAESVPALARPDDARLSPGHLDHGVIVPLSFLDPTGRWPLVVLSLSGLTLDDHRRAGAAVAAAAARTGRRIAFVASGDLSHRLTEDAPAGYAPRGATFDAAVVDAFRRSDFLALVALDPGLVSEAGECGLRSFVALSGAIPDASTAVLAYEGPWGVGYLTALLASHGLAADLDIVPVSARLDTPVRGRKGGRAGEDQHPIAALARAAVRTHLLGEPPPEPRLPVDPALPGRAGVFVTLHRGGSLRGCIGTIVPTTPTLADEVLANAVKAATHDPRFPPLEAEELDDLDIKVDVLHASEPAEIADLDPHIYGVIVSAGLRRGLLLPDLDGVDSAEQQVDIAKRKGGIRPHEAVSLERFRVDRYA